MSQVRNFYDLDVWREANTLCVEVYKFTENFPKREIYGIVDQLRRASASVGANIAEGFGRFHYKDKIKFYYNARGSVCEVQNFLFLIQELGYLDKKTSREVFQKYAKLIMRLNSFIQSVANKMSQDQ